MTAVIAGTLRSARTDLAVVVESKPWTGRGLARLLVEVRSDDAVQRMRVDIPPTWLPPPEPGLWVKEFSRRGLTVELGVEAARTTLAASDWLSAKVGDAIVFNESSPSGPSPQTGWLVCGRYAARLRIDRPGTGELIGDFAPFQTSLPPLAHASPVPQEHNHMSDRDPLTDSFTMLATAPIEVVAEIGRITMTAENIATLRAGSVLSLGNLRPDIVQLKVGDRTWAHGELVDVDGQLGVRLTYIEMLPGR